MKPKKPMKLLSVGVGLLLSTAVAVQGYQTLSGNYSDFVFRGDTTYYVAGPVYIYGTARIEGGTVVKFSPEANATIQVGSLVVCETGPYRMATFTAKDDNSVGETISGSTGTPSGYYGLTGLNFSGSLKYIRVAYLRTAFSVDTWYSNENRFSNIQIIHCGNAFNGADGAIVLVDNALISQVEQVAGGVCEWHFFGNHLTVHQADYFAWTVDDLFETTSDFHLTNSLLVGVNQLANNGSVQFFNNAVAQVPDGSGIFQSLGAGNYYLPTGSPYRDAGTTGIGTALQAELGQKTTWPPVSFDSMVTVNTTLSPQAQRDTNAPDLGYHYEPIDYWASCIVSNATLTLTNGVVIGYYRNPGIWLVDGGTLVSQGTVTSRNRITYFNFVQEQPLVFDPYGLWQVLPINPCHSDVSRNPEASLRFTTLTVPQGAYYALYCDFYEWDMKRLELRDCEVYGGGSYLYFAGSAAGGACRFQNNLFRDTSVWLDTCAETNTTLLARNNLFQHGSDVQFGDHNTGVWQVKDNVFDGLGVCLYGDVGYNAYVNGAVVYSDIQPSDIVLANFAWAAGPLGDAYQLDNDLVNRGSQTADLSGLYHYTVKTDLLNGLQIKETNSVVDLGYHYVATTASGTPIDTDTDGIPDYLEDANGNGLKDPSEGRWDLAILVQPQRVVVREGQRATFSVVAAGTPTITYQWRKDGNNILNANDSTYVINSARMSDMGYYSVEVRNPGGPLLSQNAFLKVLPFWPPITNQIPTNITLTIY
jgi:hypothetical protein